MLKIAKTMGQLDFAQLMEVYMEGNRENGMERYPDLPECRQLLRAEQDFYAYLTDVFFKTPGGYYALWVLDGRCVSALRLEPYKDGYLLAALETHPEHRRRGYAKALICAVLSMEEKIYSHVGKWNVASLGVHEKCGFRRISEQAVYLDGSVNSKCCTLCYQKPESFLSAPANSP